MNRKSSAFDVPLPLEGLPPVPDPHLRALVDTEDAIARVDAHASPEWKVAALEAVQCLASEMSSLTTDDVWHYLELHDLAAGTHEKRALGAVMRRAAQDGMISITDMTRRSERPVAHQNPKRVWRSLLHNGPIVRLASA